MQLSAPLGIFGGSFDPIHNGHIFPIIEAAKQTGIESIALMPNYLPAYKQASSTSAEHRLAMVEQLCREYPLFYPEPIEIERGCVTYSVETLQQLRQRHPDTPLCFFIGSDSLYSLPSWHRWQELLGLCHFVVCQRQCDTDRYQASPYWQQIEALLAAHKTDLPDSLHQQIAGSIYLANTVEVNLSSSEIRLQLAAGRCPANVMPSTIYQYIEQYKLYRQHQNI